MKCSLCLTPTVTNHAGFCDQCARPAMLHAESMLKRRMSVRRKGNAGCLFCDTPAMVDTVVLFSVLCHWRCYAAWTAAMYRENNDRAATYQARVAP